MRRSWRMRGSAAITILLTLAACERRTPATNAFVSHPAVRWCDAVPRAANRGLEEVPGVSDWFAVYRVDSGVFALVEARQFQEAISYLVLGHSRALLFDGGIGLVPMRPVIERLTKLPISVLNSHTHFDHVGANAEFTDVLGMDTPFTRRNESGMAHALLAGEVAPASFCGAPPTGADTGAFRTRPWTVTRRVADRDSIDLGGRVVEVLHVPGHTPDAIALLDRAHGLLFTGDSYYESSIWLFAPETDFDAYERSMARLVALAPSLRRLLPAHNTASADPAHLAVVATAVRTMRSGGGTRTPLEGDRVLVTVGDVEIMTSLALLSGKKPSGAAGGTGLGTPP